MRLFLKFILTFTCGLTINAQNIQGITNGFPINIQKVPYQVSIKNKVSGVHFCGASIINNKYVLTAGHCVDGVSASDIKLSVGLTSQNNSGENQQTFAVRRIIIHPNYNPGTPLNPVFDYDIAIIEIDGRFNFNDYVQPIELISKKSMFAETIGNQARVSGWGWTIPGKKSQTNHLQAIDVPIISNHIADFQLDTSNPSHPELTERMISTGAVEMNRQGACHGDSGGPLVYRQEGKNDIQIGVVSWGVPECLGGENSPSVYARVSELVDWVNSEVWNFAIIDGSGEVCYNFSKTFTLQNVPSFIKVTAWQASPNVTMVSSNHSGITISASAPNTTGEGWVKVTLSNGTVLTERFEVGKPPSGLSIRSLGGYQISSQRWAQLDAHYPNLPDLGWIRYQFEWIIPNSLIRLAPGGSLVSVYPLSSGAIYIRVRAANECGKSTWKWQLFNVISSNGNGGEMIPQY